MPGEQKWSVTKKVIVVGVAAIVVGVAIAITTIATVGNKSATTATSTTTRRTAATSTTTAPKTTTTVPPITTAPPATTVPPATIPAAPAPPATTPPTAVAQTVTYGSPTGPVVWQTGDSVPANGSGYEGYYCCNEPFPDGFNRAGSAGCSGQGSPPVGGYFANGVLC